MVFTEESNMKCRNNIVLIAIMLVTINPVFADLNSQISGQVSRTVSQQVNKNIADQMIKKSQELELIKEDKQVVAKEQIKVAQQLLQSLGFKPGVADGVMGKKTRKAICQFQKSEGIEQDGTLTEEVLLKLSRGKSK